MSTLAQHFSWENLQDLYQIKKKLFKWTMKVSSVIPLIPLTIYLTYWFSTGNFRLISSSFNQNHYCYYPDHKVDWFLSLNHYYFMCLRKWDFYLIETNEWLWYCCWILILKQINTVHHRFISILFFHLIHSLFFIVFYYSIFFVRSLWDIYKCG